MRSNAAKPVSEGIACELGESRDAALGVPETSEVVALL